MVSTYFLNCIMGNAFGTKTTPALPSTYYVGLSLSAPKADGSGITEPSGGGYARIGLSDLSAPSDGAITNKKQIMWSETTGDWGTVTNFVVYDAPTGGNFLFGNALPHSRTIQEGMSVVFQPDALKITLCDKSATSST